MCMGGGINQTSASAANCGGRFSHSLLPFVPWWFSVCSAARVDTTSYTALLQTRTEVAIVLHISRKTSKRHLFPIPCVQVPSLSFNHNFCPHVTFLISHKVFGLQTNSAVSLFASCRRLTGSCFSNNKQLNCSVFPHDMLWVSRMQMEIVALIGGCWGEQQAEVMKCCNQ